MASGIKSVLNAGRFEAKPLVSPFILQKIKIYTDTLQVLLDMVTSDRSFRFLQIRWV
jgi:hypothetical protein